jgi:hypothetical protein
MGIMMRAGVTELMMATPAMPLGEKISAVMQQAYVDVAVGYRRAPRLNVRTDQIVARSMDYG